MHDRLERSSETSCWSASERAARGRNGVMVPVVVKYEKRIVGGFSLAESNDLCVYWEGLPPQGMM